ncbi:MAG: HAD family hydrolase [bacterium]|nr:HAD family hydrolase [bacterium]
MTAGETPTATSPAFSPRNVRGIVFDLDGTLVDSYRAIADSLNHARAAFELPALDAAEVRRSVGHGLESLIADLVGPDRVEAGVRQFRERYADVFSELTVALPGADDALRALAAAGIRLSVASNKPARFTRLILDELGWLSMFDSVHGPDTVGTTKPDPRMIHRCAAEMGLSPDETLYVGDMVLDVDSAGRAEVPVILVEGGSSPAGDLRATGRRVLGSLKDLPPLLAAGERTRDLPRRGESG